MTADERPPVQILLNDYEMIYGERHVPPVGMKASPASSVLQKVNAQ